MPIKKNLILIVLIFFFLFLISFFYFTRQSVKENTPETQKTILKVMTYPSFISPYGPGLELKKKFEALCLCQIKWIPAQDSTRMIQRLSLRPDGLGVDVVLGLDQLTLPLAEKRRGWNPLSIDKKFLFSQNRPDWAVPFSWAPFSFISKTNAVPKNFFDLAQNKKWEKKITLPSPKTSTVGLQFYFWIFTIFKTQKQIISFLEDFKKQVYSIPHSWSASYGLFQKDFSQLTFTYQSSAVYHLKEEGKKYFFADFKEGRPYQIEYAAVPNTCRECPLAQKFISFLLTKEIQKLLMEKNYMLPVIEEAKKGTLFESLKPWPLISYDKAPLFLSEQEKWLKIWGDIFE